MAKGRIVITPEGCKSCGYCIDACPKDVIVIGKEVNSKGYLYAVAAEPEKCIGCTFCAQICPEAAIEVYK